MLYIILKGEKMEIIMLILLLTCFFGSGYLIVYIIDTFRGETELIQKHKQKKMVKSITEKLKNNEELSFEEVKLIVDTERMCSLQKDLLRHEIISDINKKEK